MWVLPGENCLYCLLENKDSHANADELKNYLPQIPRTNPVGMRVQ